MRRIPFAFLAVFLVLCIPGMCQSIDLQGTVTDRYTSLPLFQTKVTLSRLGYSAFTDSAGRFRILNTPTGLSGETAHPPLRFLPGRGLVFDCSRPGRFTLRLVDPLGKPVLREEYRLPESGKWEIRLGGLPAGLYLALLEGPSFRHSARVALMGNGKGEKGISGISREPSLPALAKNAAAIDSLWVIRSGYRLATVPVGALVQADILVLLSDTTASSARLTALSFSSGATGGVSGGVLTPAFAPEALAYATAVRQEVGFIRFLPQAFPGKPAIRVNGKPAASGTQSDPVPLSLGRNSVSIDVLSQDSTASATYQVAVHRAYDDSAALAGLALSAGSLEPAFNPGIFAYSAAIPDSVTSVTVHPQLDQPLCTLSVNGLIVASGGTSQPIAIGSGPATVALILRSPDGSRQTPYTITLRRTAAVRPPAVLASLTIGPAIRLAPAFISFITEYNAIVPAGTTTITLTARTSDTASMVRINSNPAQIGWATADYIPDSSRANACTVTVTGAGRDPRTYIVHLQRPGSNVATLIDLEVLPAIPGMKPFHPDILQYDATVGPRDSIFDITATTTQVGASMTIRATHQASGEPRRVTLVPQWNNFAIAVTSEDGAVKRVYNLTIFRPTALPKPVLTGPEYALAGVTAGFASSGISIGSCLTDERGIRADFGNGTIKNFPQSTSGGVVQFKGSWTVPGVYALRTQSICWNSSNPNFHLAYSDWSDPIQVTVVDGSQGPIRTVSGFRTTGETWYPDTTYVITGNTLFDSAATLTLLPGTSVKFIDPAFYLSVGAISAVGTEKDSIRFETGEVRVRWRGARSYNPDGTYLKGPRFEFCSFRNARLYADHDHITYGGYGYYLKNSYVHTLNSDNFGFAVGTYIEHCRIGFVNGLRLFDSRILNSYFESAALVTDRGKALEVHRCDFRMLSIRLYEFDQADITGNIIRAFNTAEYIGKLTGNNILPFTTRAVTTGKAPINLQGNYWGAALTAEMDAKGANQNISAIRDIFDDITLGKADYSGWLSAPVADAGPDW